MRAPRIKKESVETTIRTEEARRVPGTQGDTLKVVQNLPGVGRSSFGSGQLVVWGSAPRDTKAYLDGVEIPALYHVGGLRATVNSDIVGSIDLSPGAYGAEYGRGLGGLVKVETRPLPGGVHGFVSADVIDAAGMVTFEPRRGLRFGVAARQSYLDRSLSAVTSKDVGDFVPIPHYRDAQAVAQMSLRRDEDLTLLWLYSDDKLRRTIDSDDPAAIRTQATHSGFWRVLLRYSRLLPDGSSLSVTPAYGQDTDETTAAFGPVPTRLDVATKRFSLRSSWRGRVANGVTLSVGADVLATRSAVSRFGSVNLPPREGDITVFGQPPGDDVNADDWTVTRLGAAPFASFEISAGRLSLAPGLRFEPLVTDGSRLTPVTGAAPPIGFRRLECRPCSARRRWGCRARPTSRSAEPTA